MSTAEGSGVSSSEWRELLNGNLGFDRPEEWVAYAAAHGFRRVEATKVSECPGCRSASRSEWGQYVYYSTLIRLQRCEQCGLVYSDVRLDPAIVRQHFEKAYKDESYFLAGRSSIFEDVAELTAALAPQGGRVLDIGGAKGHLLDAVRRKRPDLRLTLCDVSQAACDYAREHYGLDSICASAASIAASGRRWDVVLLIDVVYYEVELRALWLAQEKVIDAGGAVLIRIPNRVHLLRAHAYLRRLTPARVRRRQDRVPFFNPEHITVMSREYIERQLAEISVTRVQWRGSPLLFDADAAWKRWLWRGARAVSRVTGGRVLLTPSVIAIGRRD